MRALQKMRTHGVIHMLDEIEGNPRLVAARKTAEGARLRLERVECDVLMREGTQAFQVALDLYGRGWRMVRHAGHQPGSPMFRLKSISPTVPGALYHEMTATSAASCFLASRVVTILVPEGEELVAYMDLVGFHLANIGLEKDSKTDWEREEY